MPLPQFPGCATVPFPDTTPDDGWTNSFDDIKCYDSLHVQAVLNQIDGYTHDRAQKVGVPTLFGTNFQAVSVGEKLAVDPVSGAEGRLHRCARDARGRRSPASWTSSTSRSANSSAS